VTESESVRALSEAATRVRRFLDERAVGRGNDPEEITWFNGHPLLVSDLRALIESPTETPGLDVERLARAIAAHTEASRKRGDLDGDDPLTHCDHYLFGGPSDCHNEIAAEYAASLPAPALKENDRG
jgi:hypothetical protein